ncbi:MAG: molybdopterin molybdotransferase MoeA [Thermoplasmata archaeon]|nr:MAG: molybdopterin molybdotransferase MoeA [Thermoplasmata archaeon]
MSAMRPFKELMDFETAKKTIMENTREISVTEKVPVREAEGRVLAATVKAPLDVPGFRRAAMDGYAVVAEDTFGAARTDPKHLAMKGKIFAGKKPEDKVVSGSCIQIATGAPMPEGADAVVMVEETSVEGDDVSIYKPVYPGANVSEQDSDIQKGTEVLYAGVLLTPPRIGVLAALGFESVEVYSRPKVMVFPTGDEVVPPGTKLQYGKVYDINSYTLTSLLQASGAEVKVMEITGDSREELKGSIERASEYDYAVFSGGSSVGERDLIFEVVAELGTLLFHGIALKPGKPTICGIVGNTMVFGMPGYPTSCLTNAYVLLLPSVRKMARLPMEPRTGKAVLSTNITSTIGRHQIYTVRVEDGVAYPAFKESGAITSMSFASGYIEISANTEYLEEGAEVVIYYF